MTLVRWSLVKGAKIMEKGAGAGGAGGATSEGASEGCAEAAGEREGGSIDIAEAIIAISIGGPTIEGSGGTGGGGPSPGGNPAIASSLISRMSLNRSCTGGIDASGAAEVPSGTAVNKGGGMDMGEGGGCTC
mmetsp:Transcript_168457/g.541338  ORF Transcript_168457/g.541338 Transcript_168457/m.541338 type:complete len:132 (+) Transcript_168457:1730-2125(+)